MEKINEGSKEMERGREVLEEVKERWPGPQNWDTHQTV